MKKPRSTLRPRSSALALEPRILFDGAAAVAAQDQITDHAVAVENRVSADPVPQAEVLAQAAPAASAPMTLLVVDARVADYQSLLTNLPENVVVRVVNATESGLDAITQALADVSGVASIQILSHGSSGSVTLGSDAIDSAALGSRSAQVQAWGSHLSANADILLYGCDVAAGPAGSALLTQLASLTRADIAASTDATGAAALGGNWVLEQQTGPIEAKLVLNDQAVAGYDALLAAPGISVPSPTINENAAYNFSGFTATYAGAETSIEAVVTVSNAASGNLSYGGFSGPQIASQGSLADINAFLNSLSFQDAAHWNGTSTINVTINVYSGNYDVANLKASTSQDFSIIVNSVNDAPSGTNNTVTINEDTPHTFTAAEFGFSDVLDGNTLNAVKISALPIHGTLTDNNVAVSLNQYVSATDIGSGKLVYTPAANDNGTGRGSFTFQVQDNGGTANSGVNLDPTPKSMAINITAVNDAPTTIAAAISGNKNSPITFNLVGSDVDGASDITKFKIDTIPTNGVLTDSTGHVLVAGSIITNVSNFDLVNFPNVEQATGLTFTPTAGYVGSDSLTFEAIDVSVAHSNVSTVSITVNSVNLPPVVTVPGAQSVNEDSSLILPGDLPGVPGLSLSDPDAGGAVVQETISAGQGNISFSSLAGITVTAGANNSRSVTVQGTIVAINTALGSSNLSYAPDHNYPNSTSSATDTITVVANDLGNTGGTAQTNTKTITVTVHPVPDKPVTGAASLASVVENNFDGAGATVAALLPAFSDADGNTLAGVAISADASNSAQGVWQYSVNAGVSWQAVGSVSPTTALALNTTSLLRFVPAANFTGTPGALTLQAMDNSGVRTYTSSGSRQTVDVTLTNIDIAATGSALATSVSAVAYPFVQVNNTYMSVPEGTTVTLGTSTLDLTNVNATAAQIVYTVTANTLSNGQLLLDSAHDGSFSTVVGNATTFTQDDINNNRLRYVHDGSEPAYSSDQTISYSVSGGGTTEAHTLTIKVSPVNDVPVLYVPGNTAPGGGVLVANVARGGVFDFSTAAVQVVDPDNTNAQLVFKLVSLPANGTLTLNGAGVDVGTIFSYANLAQLIYTHSGVAGSSDSFSVTLRDGAGGVVGATVINLTISNSAPVVATADTLAGSQDTTLTINPTTLLANDSGAGLTVTGVAGASQGVVTLSGGGIQFVPTTGYHGVGGFDYTVTDGNNNTATAHVSVTIGAAPYSMSTPA